MSQNGSGYETGGRHPDEDRERAFNAPWPVLVLVVGLIGLYALQAQVPDQAAVFYRLGLIPGHMDPAALVTSVFVHGGWAHVMVNALGALAFGAGICRLFRTGPLGALGFFAFVLLCGVLSGLGYVAVKSGSLIPVVGASGAVSGLMGASSRLLDRQFAMAGRGGPPRLAPFTSPTVIGMGIAIVILNLLFAVFGFAPGMGAAQIAWEAHLFGYAAGLLLVGPFAWILERLRGDGLG